jgi:membrane-associated protease RseP (regulator of RpoE activity)
MRAFIMLCGMVGLMDSGAFAATAGPDRASHSGVNRAAPPAGGGRGYYGGGYYGGRYYGRPYDYNRFYNGGFYGGFGIGIGFGFYGGGIYPYPYYYASPWDYAATSVRVYPAPAPTEVAPAPRVNESPRVSETSPPPLATPPNNGRETGLRITNLEDKGPAATGLLRVGDTILGVNETRVRNFDDLRSALTPLNGNAQIIFINGENGKLEKLSIKIANGHLGASVEEMALPAPPATPPSK